MRHAKSRHQINRFTSWHKATLESMARSIILYQSIKTTKAKAKAAQSLIEKLITLGKDNNLAARRRAFEILSEHRLVNLLFTDIAPRFKNINGGYTRILPFTTRRGDAAQVVIFELTQLKKKEIKKPKKEKAEAGIAHTEKPKSEEPKEVKERPRTSTALAEEEKKHDITKKPAKGFLKGIRGIFKKERDSL